MGVRGLGRAPPLPFLPVSPSQKQKQSQRRKSSTPPPQSKAWVRIAIFALAIVFAFGSVIAIAIGSSGNSGNDTASTTAPSTAATPAAASVAGKPCVAETGTPPAGAPVVPVEVGPPPTTLVSKDLEVGTGPTVAPGATVTVDYIGVSCSTGVIFDSSYKGGQPVTLPLANMIPGWTNGIPGMKVGGTRLLGIPPDQAYGDNGQGPDIAPGETLWFVVKVESTQ